jgi:hypothetical protein
MTKSFLPTVKPPKRSTRKLTGWNKIDDGHFFGFVSNLKGIGLVKIANEAVNRVSIDIAVGKVALMTPDDWAEVQEAVRVFLVEDE